MKQVIQFLFDAIGGALIIAIGVIALTILPALLLDWIKSL